MPTPTFLAEEIDDLRRFSIETEIPLKITPVKATIKPKSLQKFLTIKTKAGIYKIFASNIPCFGPFFWNIERAIIEPEFAI